MELVYVILTSIVEFVKDRQFWTFMATDPGSFKFGFNGNFSLASRKKAKEMGTIQDKNAEPPSMLVLPFIKISTSMKFWETGNDDSISRINFCEFHS